MKNDFWFHNDDVYEMVKLIRALTIEGLSFTTCREPDGYSVTLTGGY